jgi:hypothetical protein
LALRIGAATAAGSSRRRRTHEAYRAHGHRVNRQVVTAEVVKRIPFVALMTEIALERGLGVVKKIMEALGRIGRLSRRVPGCPELMEGEQA